MGLVAQIGKFPNGNEENKKWNLDMGKHPAMRYSVQVVWHGTNRDQAGSDELGCTVEVTSISSSITSNA